MNTGILPALAQQVMKNRQILSDGFRNKIDFRVYPIHRHVNFLAPQGERLIYNGLLGRLSEKKIEKF
ncbi:MAG: hypothetical protein GKR87_09500 [Kiritimatiellae bacterium]|nr:hypothetical protein [Kiritimatiellia bacterium]